MPAKQTQAAVSAPYFATESSEKPRFVIAENGYFIYANEGFCALSGLNADSIQATKADEILNFKTLKIGKTLKKITNGEHQVQVNGHKDAVPFHFDWLTSSDDKRYLVASAIQEVEELPAHEPLEKSKDAQNEELDHFFALSKDVMLITDKDGTILHTNKRFEEVLGYTEVELTNINFKTLFGDIDENTRKNLDTGQTSFEAEMQTKDGSNCHMKWRQQEIGNRIYYMGRDLTSAQKHEAERTKRRKQLAEAEEIGRMGHWRWIIGEDDIQWSNEIFRIFGADKERFRPTIDRINALVLRSDLHRVARAFERAIMEQKDYDMEFCIKQIGGDIRYIRCRGRCEFDEDGDVTALYGVLQDVTETMLYERELRQAKDSAERAYAAKTQFLANMSHELRTPLNAIIGFSEMMQRQLLGPIGTEKYIEYVDGIRESGEHLLDLIGDILDMSKIEAGKYELDFSEVKIAKTLETASNMVLARAQEKGVTLTKSANCCEKLKIVADRRAVLQILLNVLSNAVKFTEEGGTISAECFEREDYLSIKISDTGIGIPPNKLASITKPFEQVSSSYTRDHEGSGLGLAITKELVEMHGGAMAIDSAINAGTTVTIRLPYDASKTIN